MKTINKNTSTQRPVFSVKTLKTKFQNYTYKQVKTGLNTWFTLVELIIVITILAILATIAFVSFQNYTKDARDGNRVSTITNIQKWLELYAIKTWKYPNPEDIYASGFININSKDETLFEVWYVKEGISRMINFSKTPIDPVWENNYYVYGVSYDNKQYQIWATLENLQTSIIVPTTYANSLQAHVSGNYKWIIKKWDIYSNPESLILPTSYSWGTNLANDTYFVTDKWQNLPYKKNQTTTLTWWTTKTITWITINEGNWDSLSWSIQTTLWVSADLVWVMVYWEKEYFSSVKDGGSTETTPDTTPPAGSTCGSAHTSTVASAPTTNLCSDTSSPTVSWTWPWTWTCGTSSCSANKTLAVWYNVSTVSWQPALYAWVYDPTGSNPRILWVAWTENTWTWWKSFNTETSLSTVNSTTNWENNITAIKAIDSTLANHPAAKYCDDLNRAWYTDWYLPAQSTDNVTTTDCSTQSWELQFLYCQHKWNDGNQALLGFASDHYWSSTEYSASLARVLDFNSGYWSYNYKYNSKFSTRRVRCVRVAD